MVQKARIENNHTDILFENKFFFIEGIGKYLHARHFTFNVISSNIDLYKVDDLKDNLVTDGIFFVLFSGTVSFLDFPVV